VAWKSLKRRCADDDDDDAVDTEQPANKRMRNLRDTMAGLRKSITTAAADNKWHNASPWAQDTVAFHAGELIAVMQTIVQDAQTAGQQQGVALAVIDKVANFITIQLVQHAQCTDLRHFHHIFEKFSAMGATSTGIIKIIEKLIAAKDTDNMIDFSDVDVVDRNTFWDTPLWTSYCEDKFRSCMKSAKNAFAAGPAATPWTDDVELALQLWPVDDGLL
jgi:hypothetical protein